MSPSARKITVAILVPAAGAALLALGRVTADSFGMLSTSGFMPHRMCLYGSPFLVWFNAIADEIIAICYLAIPLILIRVFIHGISIQPADSTKISHATVLLPWFSAFIICCGMTHQMDVITLWYPFYYMDAILRGFTVIASVGTAIVLAQKIPVLLGIVSSADLLTQVQLLAAQVERLTKAAIVISEKREGVV